MDYADLDTQIIMGLWEFKHEQELTISKVAGEGPFQHTNG